jgi:hypothetical protein
VDIYIHIFLTSALVGGEWSALPQGKSPEYPMDGRVGPPTGLNNMEKRKFLPIQVLKLQPLGRPACSQMIPTALSQLYVLKVTVMFVWWQLTRESSNPTCRNLPWFFFTARPYTSKSTVKILAAGTHCKYFLKIVKVTHFFCTRNRLYQRFVQPSQQLWRDRTSLTLGNDRVWLYSRI